MGDVQHFSVWNQARSTTWVISLGILRDFLLAVTGTCLKPLDITGAKSAASKCGWDHMTWQRWCPSGGRVSLVAFVASCSPNANSSQIVSGSSAVFRWNFSTLFREDYAVSTVSRRWVNKVPEGLEIRQSDMAASQLDGNTLEKNVLDCYELWTKGSCTERHIQALWLLT